MNELELDQLPFSLQLDESKDHNGESIINVLLSNVEGCWLLDTSVLEDQKGATIRNHLRSLLRELHLSTDLLYSIPTDNCAAALAGARGLYSKTLMGMGVRCLSHGLNLVEQHFCKELKHAMKLVKRVSSYLHGAGQTSGRKYRASKAGLQVAALRFAPTRWSSRVSVALSIVKQWDDLGAYLQAEQEVNENASAARKLEKLMSLASVKIQMVLLTSLKQLNAIVKGSQGRWRSHTDPFHIQTMRLYLQTWTTISCQTKGTEVELEAGFCDLRPFTFSAHHKISMGLTYIKCAAKAVNEYQKVLDQTVHLVELIYSTLLTC